MPDPHVLYVVTAVVVFGLVVWVGVVLSMPDRSAPGAVAESKALPAQPTPGEVRRGQGPPGPTDASN